jgi:trk system potassium uptake protein TrkA
MGVVRDDKFIILKKTDKIIKGDKAYVVINASQMKETLVAFGHN